jgi:hypothetical protein
MQCRRISQAGNLTERRERLWNHDGGNTKPKGLAAWKLQWLIRNVESLLNIIHVLIAPLNAQNPQVIILFTGDILALNVARRVEKERNTFQRVVARKQRNSHGKHAPWKSLLFHHKDLDSIQ